MLCYCQFQFVFSSQFISLFILADILFSFHYVISIYNNYAEGYNLHWAHNSLIFSDWEYVLCNLIMHWSFTQKVKHIQNLLNLILSKEINNQEIFVIPNHVRTLKLKKSIGLLFCSRKVKTIAVKWKLSVQCYTSFGNLLQGLLTLITKLFLVSSHNTVLTSNSLFCPMRWWFSLYNNILYS